MISLSVLVLIPADYGFLLWRNIALLQLSHLVSLQAPKSASIGRGWPTKWLKFSEHRLSNRKTTWNTYKDVFWRMLGLHQQGLNQQNVRALGLKHPGELNPGAMNTAGGIKWCDISNEHVIGPVSENENATGKSYVNILIPCVAHISDCCEKTRRLAGWCLFAEFKPSYNLFDQKVSKTTGFQDVDQGPLNWSTPLLYLTIAISFMKSYQMKNIFNTHRLHGRGEKQRLKHRIWAEIPRINQKCLTSVWNNTNLLLNHIMKVDDGPIVNIMV